MSSHWARLEHCCLQRQPRSVAAAGALRTGPAAQFETIHPGDWVLERRQLAASAACLHHADAVRRDGASCSARCSTCRSYLKANRARVLPPPRPRPSAARAIGSNGSPSSCAASARRRAVPPRRARSSRRTLIVRLRDTHRCAADVAQCQGAHRCWTSCCCSPPCPHPGRGGVAGRADLPHRHQAVAKPPEARGRQRLKELTGLSAAIASGGYQPYLDLFHREAVDASLVGAAGPEPVTGSALPHLVWSLVQGAR